MTKEPKQIPIEAVEEIKEEVHYYVLNSGLWQFRLPVKAIVPLNEKLLKLRAAGKQQPEILEWTRLFILNKLKFRKQKPMEELPFYIDQQPALNEIVEVMTVKIYKVANFKLDDGQQKLTDDKNPPKPLIQAQAKKRSHHKKNPEREE